MIYLQNQLILYLLFVILCQLYKIYPFINKPSISYCYIFPAFSRLNDELLHYILKIVVRESCILITKCQTVSKDDFQKLLSTVPVSKNVFNERKIISCPSFRFPVLRCVCVQTDTRFTRIDLIDESRWIAVLVLKM